MLNRHRYVSGVARLAVLLTLVLVVPTASAAQKPHHKVVCHRNAHHRLTCHTQSRAAKHGATKTKKRPPPPPRARHPDHRGPDGPVFAGSVGSAAPFSGGIGGTRPGGIGGTSHAGAVNRRPCASSPHLDLEHSGLRQRELDPNSAAIVGNLVQQAATEGLGIATTSYGVPIYTSERLSRWST